MPWTTAHVNKVGTPLKKKLKEALGFFESESDLHTKPQPFPGLEFPLCGIQVFVVLLLYNLLQQTRKNVGSSLSDLPTTLVGDNGGKQKPGFIKKEGGKLRRQNQCRFFGNKIWKERRKMKFKKGKVKTFRE